MQQETPPRSASSPGRGARLASWLIPLAVFLASVGMTLGVYTHISRQAEVEWHADNAHDAALITSELRERLRMHAQMLRGIRAFFVASDEVSAAEWARFTGTLHIERNIPGVQAYGYAPRTTAPDGEKLTVRYIAPLNATNHAGLDFDLLSEPRRREAIELARDRDEVVISRRVELIVDRNEERRQPGLLMIVPIYAAGKPHATVDERRIAFSGVVFAAYRVGDLMQSLTYANSQALALRLFDEESFNQVTAEPVFSLLHETGATKGPMLESREMEFGLRNWHLRFFHGDASHGYEAPVWVLVSGLLVSLLFAGISRIQTVYRLRAENLAREMTAELRRSEQRFKLAADGTNDGIWDRDLERGTVWHSERMKQLLGFPPDTDTANVAFFLSRVHADDRDALDSALRTHLQDHRPYSVDYRFLKGDGTWAWFRSRGQGVWNADGKPIRLVGSITDISSQKLTEARVAHYRDFLLTVLKFIPHPVFVKNRSGEYIAVNAAFCRLLGEQESDIVGRTHLPATPFDSPMDAHIREMDERVFAGAGEQVEELALALKDGPRTVIARKALANDPDGEPILIGTLTDITDLRSAEQARAAADRQRKAILDAATEVSIIATDTRGTIRLFNRGAEKMLGYRAEEVVDVQTPAIFHLPDEVDARGRFLSAELGISLAGFEVFVAIARLHGAERREWTYLRKDGSRLTVSLVVTAVHGESGEISGYLGIATDISERKAAAAALERQSAQMRTIIEHIPGGVSLIDSELHFIVANEELKKVLEFPDSLFASGWPSLYEVALFNARRGEYGPGDPQTLAMEVVERARHPAPHHFERTRPNGRTIEVRGTPLPDGGFVTIYTDITERKAAEAELRRHRDHLQELVDERTVDLRRAKEAAERASEAKSEFLANMSHELRTPMHSVLSFAALGEERARKEAQEKLAHYFQRIHQSGDRLLALLNNLLDLSKLEAGMMQLDRQDCDINAVVREAVLESEVWARSRDIAITMTETVADARMHVDPVRIGQVVRNLLSNAIKFSPNGGKVAVALRADAMARGRRTSDPLDLPAVRIEVVDTGIGIPESELDSIFDKFVQSSKTKTGAGGTGLGLAISREIIEAHRGTIRACNNPDVGASFIVTLPRTSYPTHGIK